MSSKPAATGEDAIKKLAAFPPLPNVDMSLTAVGPDQDSDLSGFRIKLTIAAKAAIAQVAQDTRDRLEDATPIGYGPAVLVPPQHWMYVNESQSAVLSTVEQVVQAQDLIPFVGDAEYAAHIKMVGARFTTPSQETVTFYRIADSLLQFKKSRLIGLLQTGDVYDRLEPSDVLLLRADFDVVVIDGFAFFTKKATFERAFGFYDELKKQSLATFKAVTSNLKIQGLQKLQEACTSQPQMMAKMASIKRSMDEDPDYAAAMTMPNLIKYIKSHPHVDIEIIGKGPSRELVFDPKPARRFQIVKLLDDDFLRSVLTSREYEAGSKTQAK